MCVGGGVNVWNKLKPKTIVDGCVVLCYYDYKNMTSFLPNPLSSIFLSFGKRRQA